MLVVFCLLLHFITVCTIVLFLYMHHVLYLAVLVTILILLL